MGLRILSRRLAPQLRSIPQHKATLPPVAAKRWNSSLPSNPRIRVFPDTPSRGVYLFTYLKSDKPSTALAIGTSTKNPPTPGTFEGNPRFLSILNDVLAENAHNDAELQGQARAFAGPGGTSFAIGAPSTSGSSRKPGSSSKHAGEGGGGGASAQGGAGGANRGGFVHLSDSRNPPDFGRIAWPEDILGSVEVDGSGDIVGRMQPSGTYRVLTNEGMLGLSPFLTEMLIRRLEEEEKEAS